MTLMGKQWTEERLEEELQIPVSNSIRCAMFINIVFPEFTIKEAFEKLDDPVFLEALIETIKEVCDE